MATRYAVADTGILNDHGIVMAGGTIVSSRWSTRGKGETRELGTPTQTTSMSGLHKALVGGTFCVLTPSEYVIRRVTSTIAGLSNTSLRSGASDFGVRHSIHYIENIKTTFLTTLSWTSSIDGQPVYTLTKSDQSLSFGTDDEARSNMASPGELVYLANGKVPTQKDYPARTN